MKRNAREKHGKKTKSKNEKIIKLRIKNEKSNQKNVFLKKKKKQTRKSKNEKEKVASKGYLPRRLQKIFFRICYKKSCSSWGQKMKQSKNKSNASKK